MRVTRFLVMVVPFAFAGVTNVLMVQAGTYTDGAGLGVLVTAIAAMTVLLYVLERNAKARTNAEKDRRCSGEDLHGGTR